MNIILSNFESTTKVEVNPNDTIQQIKQKIKEIHDIDVDEQELYFGNQKLNAEKNLSEYNIENNERIRLVQLSSSGFQIYIHNNRSIAIQVRHSYTIEKVKELYQDRMGFS